VLRFTLLEIGDEEEEEEGKEEEDDDGRSGVIKM
jgi:hypothetical protein